MRGRFELPKATLDYSYYCFRKETGIPEMVIGRTEPQRVVPLESSVVKMEEKICQKDNGTNIE
tara:strand:- start:1805 stop:1993 length:189 start_codon:yes stop_codon:yes gene_type:complete